MELPDILKPERCLCMHGYAAKQPLLMDLAKKSAEGTGLDSFAILQALQQREQLGSTGLGEGIALPHARFAELAEPFVMIVKLKVPLDFDAIDEKPVDLVGLVLLPATMEKEQLTVLSCIARALRRPEIIVRARSARDGRALYDALTRSQAA